MSSIDLRGTVHVVNKAHRPATNLDLIELRSTRTDGRLSYGRIDRQTYISRGIRSGKKKFDVHLGDLIGVSQSHQITR